MPKSGAVVEGVLYEIDKSDTGNLDRFEGFPSHYNRINVKVKLDDSHELEAFTYIAQPDKIRDGLKPTKEYLSHYFAARDILSKEYLHTLETLQTLD